MEKEIEIEIEKERQRDMERCRDGKEESKREKLDK